MRIMSRMGTPALKVLGKDGAYVPCMHTVSQQLRARNRGGACVSCKRTVSLYQCMYAFSVSTLAGFCLIL